MPYCQGAEDGEQGSKLVERIKTVKNRNAAKPTGLYWSLRFNAVKSSNKTVTDKSDYIAL